MLTAVAAPLLVAAALGSGSSFTQLGDQVAERLVAVFGSPDRHVAQVLGDGRLLVEPGGLVRATELELLTDALPLRDPSTLEIRGALYKPIATGTVIASNAESALVALDRVEAGATPAAGDIVRTARGALLVGLASGAGSPELDPALQALLNTLPCRLERTGLFSVRKLERGGRLLLATRDFKALLEAARADGLDALLWLSLHREQGQVQLLAELVSNLEGGEAQVFTAATPMDAALTAYIARPDAAGEGPQPLSRASLPGQVLSLAITPDGEGHPAVLALTEEAVWIDATTTPRRLIDLTALARSAVAVRQAAGSLVVLPGSGAASPSIAFGTNQLQFGYLFAGGELIALEGVPLARGQAGLLLAHYRAGQDVFDGTISEVGRSRDVGPFLGLRARPGGFVLQRPDLGFELLNARFEPGEPIGVTSGDAWTQLGDAWLAASPDPATTTDNLRVVEAGRETRWLDSRNGLAALGALTGPAPRVAVAEMPTAGSSVVSLYAWPW